MVHMPCMHTDSFFKTIYLFFISKTRYFYCYTEYNLHGELNKGKFYPFLSALKIECEKVTMHFSSYVPYLT
jgi:hypothetical protein